MPYTLPNDGDEIEKAYYGLFLHGEFPAYEQFWSAFVTPLSNRPNAFCHLPICSVFRSQPPCLPPDLRAGAQRQIDAKH